MKCLLIGDIFISPDVMEEAIMKYPSRYTEVKKYYFGTNDRKEMREIVKKIEEEGIYSVEVPEGVKEDIKDADVVMVHLCPITSEMIESAKKLKVILSNRGGKENIDEQAAKANNIKILNNPAHNANAVAEYTIGLMICEQRNICRSHCDLKKGIWREKYPNSIEIKELKSSTVGLIGYGNVGKLVAEKLKSFNTRILVFDPYVGTNVKIDSIDFVTLDYLLKESDIVSLHARTEEKTPIITKEKIGLMKKEAYLINTARSYLIDMDSLYTALENNDIFGASIDVHSIEPLPKDYKFLKLDNVTLTNHRGGDTINSYIDSPLMLFNGIEKYFIDNGVVG